MWLGVKGRRQAHRSATSDNQISKATFPGGRGSRARHNVSCAVALLQDNCVLRRGPLTLIFGNLLIKICKICIKIRWKSTKYPLSEPPWDALGTMLAALGNQDVPKRRPRAPRRRQNLNFRANLAQLGSNLEAQNPPKSFPNAAQDPARCTFTTSLALLSPLSAFALIFVGFFSDFKKLETWKILVFPRENAIFYKIAIFDKNTKNNRKISLKPSQNPPKPSPNPPKIHSKSMKNKKNW